MKYIFAILLLFCMCGSCFCGEDTARTEIFAQIKNIDGKIRDIRKQLENIKGELNKGNDPAPYRVVDTVINIQINESDIEFAKLEYERRKKNIERLQEWLFKTYNNDSKQAEKNIATAKASFEDVQKTLRRDGSTVKTARI